MTSDSKEGILDQIKTVKNAFLNVNTTGLYDAYNGASVLFLTYKQYGGSPGWSQNIKDRNGSHIYSTVEQNQLESSFKGLSSILDPIFLNTQQQQQGGSLKPGFSPNDMLKYQNQFGPINPDDISIDKTYKKISEYIEQLDEKNRILAKTLGPFKFFDDMKVDPKIPLPPPFPPLSIPARSIVPIMMTFLELIRLFVSFGTFKSDYLRKISTFLLALGDLANGSWKNALLTSAGLFGSTPLLIGVVGKLLNNTFELMSPEIRATLSESAYRGTKSVFIGFWLYMFSILSPDIVRTMVSTSLEALTQPLKEFNKKIENLESKLQTQMGPQGIQIQFKRLPLDMIPSLDDIQNIQVLAARPEIYCSPEFQEVLEPLIQIIPIRLVLELLSIPVLPEDKEKACSGVDTSGISGAVAKQFDPQVTPIPGGPLEKKMDSLSKPRIAVPPTRVKTGGVRKGRKSRRLSRSPRNSGSRSSRIIL